MLLLGYLTSAEQWYPCPQGGLRHNVAQTPNMVFFTAQASAAE